MTKKEQTGLFLVLATALISGFSIFINKFGIEGLDPFVFTGLKNFFVAGLLFLLIFAGQGFKGLKNLRDLRVKDWLTLFVIGLLGGSLPFLLFFKGLSLTSAAQASLIHKNLFLLATPLAIIFLKEKLSKNFFLSGLALLIGNLLFFKILNFRFGPGDLLILMATTLWAVENIVSKKVLQSLPAQVVGFGRMFFGSLVIMVFLFISGKIKLVTQLNFQQISWIGLTSLLLLAFVTTWYAGLKRLRVSVATSVLVLGSPTTAFLTVVFLNGAISPLQIIGGSLLMLGVFFLHQPCPSKCLV